MAIIRKINTFKSIIHNILKEEYLSMVLSEITSKEAKKRFYSDIDDKLYGTIINLDPTYIIDNDVMGSYTKWLFRPDNLAQLKKTKEEDFYKIKDDLSKFHKLKITNKLPQEFKDINNFTLDKLSRYIFNNYSKEDLLSKSEEIKNLKSDVEKYDFPEWTVIVPKTEEASCYYGKGTRWCTAAIKSNNYFSSYNRSGKLWILINKNDKSEKYQLHFENGEFMDVMDKEYPLKEILDSDDKLYNFFVEKYSKEIINYAIMKSEFDLFADVYKHTNFDEEEKNDIVINILKNASDCDYSTYNYLSILEIIDGVSKMKIRKDRNSYYGRTLYCLINNNYYGDESMVQDVMWLINIFGGVKDIDDMEVLYKIIYNENPEILINIVEQMNLENLFYEFIVNNNLESKIKTNIEMLSVISDLKEKFETYPIIQNKIVKIEIKIIDYKNNKFKIDLGLKNNRGKIVKKYSGVIDYKSIYDYINNYKLMMDGKISIKPIV